MNPTPLVYHVRQKMPWVLEAMAHGAQADTLPADRHPLDRTRTCIIGGLQHGSLELMQQVMASNFRRYLFVDAAYFDSGRAAHRHRFRVVPGAYLQNWTDPVTPDRFEALPIKLAPWRSDGKWILVCPPSSPETESLFGVAGWLGKTLPLLGEHTDRPIKVRRKGDPESLQAALADAYAVVTFQSNIAVDAVVAGVPVFVDPINAAAPVGETDFTRIETPRRPDREPWAWSLAWGQFTIPEMESGFCWRNVASQLERRLAQGAAA